MKKLWEILVPTKMKFGGNVKPQVIAEKFHKAWDGKVRKIAGGLTAMRSAKGHWVSPDGELFVEKMIPVRIYCSYDEIHLISDMTAKHYKQQSIMFYLISTEVVIKHYKGTPKR